MAPPVSLIERLYFYAANNPDHDAVVSGSTSLSYAQLAKLVNDQVRTLEKSGVTENSVLGISCANDMEHLLLCLAATHIGATSCTIPSHEAEQAQASLNHRCNVTHQVQSSIAIPTSYAEIKRTGDVVTTAMQPPAPDARVLFSTSGSTGEPKLVVHHGSDLVAQAHRHISSPQERFACLASMEHNFAKRHRLYTVAAGATNVLLDTTGEKLVEQCLSLAINVLHVSAFQAQELLALDKIEQLNNIRLKLGGGHVPLGLRQKLKTDITNNLQAGYGTTETGAIAFTDPQDRDAGESVGRPLPGIDVRVVCPRRQPISTGKHGELAIRCNGMFREYLGKPEKTAAQLENDWFYTGDIGYLDNQQRIYLCGRSDDMFVFNSMNIYPQDIESTILQHPDIAEAAVIPKASPVHGNIPVALLVFKNNVKQRLPKIQKFVKKRVGVRSPRQYIIVPEIPKTASGKISRSTASNLPGKSSELRSAILSTLSASTLELVKPSVIHAFIAGDQDIRLKQLEMDSLARMDFLVSLELEYDTVITPQDFGNLRYLGNVVAKILSPKKSPVLQSGPNGRTNRNTNSNTLQTSGHPHMVRFFQRVFRFCHTVVEFNKFLATLEKRLTPLDVENLHTFHLKGQLLPDDAAEKFHVAASHWLQETKRSMLLSGKERPEPFLFRKITPATSCFFGHGIVAAKTLLICFPPRDMSQMGIPNPVLLQHVDAKRFDLLIISSPFNTGYRLGRSRFKKTLKEFSTWLNTQDWIQNYGKVRTLGFSAGGRAAITTGYLLNAEMAMSVNGRFHRKRHILKNLDQTLTIWKAVRTEKRLRVLLSYTPDNPRDRIYARIMAFISGGTRNEITYKQERLKHLVFGHLLEHGELATYLNHSILDNSEAAPQNHTSSLPSKALTGPAAIKNGLGKAPQSYL